MNYFTLHFLQTINDWQAGAIGKKTDGMYVSQNKKEVGDKLKSFTGNLPVRFTTYNGVCYRKFNSSDNLILGLGQHINEEYSSWTTDYEIAKSDNFLKEYSNKQIGIIVKKNIFDNNVLLNLEALYADNEFNNACKSYSEEIKNYDKGIGKYNNKQKEIILTETNFSIDEIVAYRGKGKNRNEFIQTYFSDICEKDKQHIIQVVNKSYPNIGKKKWVDSVNVLDEIKSFSRSKANDLTKKKSSNNFYR